MEKWAFLSQQKFYFTGGIQMDIEIRKLTVELLEDYLLFFDTYENCYCTCYSSDNHEGKDFSKKETRRKHAVQYVSNGMIQGYLAYSDNQVVGWCNANDRKDCLKCEGWKVMLSSVSIFESDLEVKIKSVFCFTIAPDFRRKGISALLLEQVCEDAAKDGFDCVEAYPNKNFIDTFHDHMGPVELYVKYGFVTHEEAGDKVAMRKYL